MTEAQMWDDDEPVQSAVTVPPWIEADISPATIVAVVEGGCESGAYMPAVTYCEALDTMSKHGDQVFDYLAIVSEGDTDFRETGESLSWSGLACRYLSRAVELWAQNAYATLEELDDV